MQLQMTPFSEKNRLVTHTTYECELNGKTITVIDNHHNGTTSVYFPDNSSVEFRNQIESRAKLSYSTWLLKKLIKIKDLEKRLTQAPQKEPK